MRLGDGQKVSKNPYTTGRIAGKEFEPPAVDVAVGCYGLCGAEVVEESL